MSSASPTGKVSKWQSFSSNAGGKQQEHFKHHNQNHSLRNKRKASSPRKHVSHSRDINYHGKYMAFYGSVLSNFHLGNPFRGSDAMPYLLAELDNLNIVYPAADSIAVHIMSRHKFICGEQFMMACKAFLFELPDLALANTAALAASDNGFIDSQTQVHNRLYLPHDEYEALVSSERQLQSSNFMRLLRSTRPPDIKALGRQTPRFNDDIWTRASKSVVVAASLARAEADPDLAKIYRDNWSAETNTPHHHFVEASPSDRVWGIGLRREDPKIGDPQNWRGENRLGHSHDEACRLYNEKLTKEVQ